MDIIVFEFNQTSNLFFASFNYINNFTDIVTFIISVQGTNIANPRNLNPTQLQDLVAHIAFPADYNFTLPDHVEYKLTTKEYVLIVYWKKEKRFDFIDISKLKRETNSDEYLTSTNFYPRDFLLYKNSPEYYCQGKWNEMKINQL